MTHNQTPRWYPWAFLALALAYVMIQAGAWHAPLCFLDDTGELFYVRSGLSWHDLFLRDFYGFFRPLKNLLFLGFNGLIRSGGMAPAHAAAIVVGLGSLLAVNQLFRRLLENPWTALTASAVWLFAPTMVSCTAWLSSVNIQAMTGFVAGAVLLHLQASEGDEVADAVDGVSPIPQQRPRASSGGPASAPTGGLRSGSGFQRVARVRWMVSAGSAACALLAMLCYEGAVCLPLLLMATDLWLRPERVRTHTAQRGYLLAALMLAVFLVLRALGGSRGQLSGSFAEITRWQVAFSSAHFMLLHLGIWLCPFGRQVLFGGYYWGQVPVALLALEWLALGLLAAATLAWWRHAPRLTLGLVWFFVGFAPMSNVLGFKNGPYGDYYMACASLGLALSCAAGGEALWRKMRGQQGWQAAAALAVLTLGVGWRLAAAVESAAWVQAWNDPVALLERSARTFPEAFDVLTELAKQRVEQGRLAEARALAERAITLAPQRAGAYAVLAVVAEQCGDTPAAWTALRRFLKLSEQHTAWGWFFAGYLSEARDHDPEQAERSYREALAGTEAWTADHVSAAEALGLLLASRGRVTEAIPLMQRAAALAPEHAPLQHNLAVALQKAGRKAEAADHERRYRELMTAAR